jgi:hypothetical protein
MEDGAARSNRCAVARPMPLVPPVTGNFSFKLAHYDYSFNYFRLIIARPT